MTRRRTTPGDPSLVAIEKMRRRWAAARSGSLDLAALERALRAAFPGRETRALGMEGYPGAARIFVRAGNGWRSMYAFDVAHVSDFAAGALRVSWP